MELTEKLDLLEKYYRQAAAGRMSYERRVLCTKILQSGLMVKHIMDAIDAAVFRYGMNGMERDYWGMIRGECQKTYRDLKKAGVIG